MSENPSMIPGRGMIFIQNTQSDPGAHLASYSVGKEVVSTVGTRSREADHSPHLVRKLRMSEATLLFPHTFSWRAKGQLHLRTLSVTQIWYSINKMAIDCKK